MYSDNVLDNLCNMIRKSRKSVGLTQADLGKIVGVSKSTIAKWEKKGNFPILQLNQICVALNLKCEAEWIKNTKEIVFANQDICKNRCNKEVCEGRDKVFNFNYDGDKSVGLEIAMTHSVPPEDCPYITEHTVIQKR